MLEGIATLSALVHRFDVMLDADGAHVAEFNQLTLQMARGLKVRVSERTMSLASATATTAVAASTSSTTPQPALSSTVASWTTTSVTPVAAPPSNIGADRVHTAPFTMSTMLQTKSVAKTSTTAAASAADTMPVTSTRRSLSSNTRSAINQCKTDREPISITLVDEANNDSDESSDVSSDDDGRACVVIRRAASTRVQKEPIILNDN